MNHSLAKTGAALRRDERSDLSEHVTVELLAAELVGPGENISAQGVYFTTDATISVRVRIGSEERVLPGQLIRVETIGDGRIGIAVRFLESQVTTGN